MVRKINSQHLLLHGHTYFLGKGSDIRKLGSDVQRIGTCILSGHTAHIKERDLTGYILFGFILGGLHEALKTAQHGGLVAAQALHGAGLDERLHSLLVDLAYIHIIDKLENILRQAFALSGFDDGLDGSLAYVLYSQKSEAYLAVLYGEFFEGLVHIRRQYLDSHIDAVPDISGYLLGIAHDGSHEGCHEFNGIVFLQVSGLICHYRIGCGVGLVEGIGCKGHHVVEYGLRSFPGYAVSDASGDLNVSLFIQLAVDEEFLFLHHDLVLLLGHGTAHQVGSSVAVSSQVSYDLHYLLLVYETAVGNVQNRRKFIRDIADLFRMFLVLDVFWNGVHGTRSVEGYSCDDIFKARGLQVFHELGHSAGFQLENAGSVALCYHLIYCRIVISHLREIYLCAVLPFYHFKGIPYYRKVPQSQEVHLEKPQFLDGGHGELGSRALVTEIERHIFVYGKFGNNHAGRMGGCVARHTFKGSRHVDDPLHFRISVIEWLEL